MGLAGAPMPSLTEDTAAEDEDGPDEGVGDGIAGGSARQVEGAAHEVHLQAGRVGVMAWCIVHG
jgi:hypothetical protein